MSWVRIPSSAPFFAFRVIVTPHFTRPPLVADCVIFSPITWFCYALCYTSTFRCIADSKPLTPQHYVRMRRCHTDLLAEAVRNDASPEPLSRKIHPENGKLPGNPYGQLTMIFIVCRKIRRELRFGRLPYQSSSAKQYCRTLLALERDSIDYFSSSCSEPS